MVGMRVTANSLSRRGAGLGNEVIPWAKSLLAARALGGRQLAPRWLLNPYGLGLQLGFTRPGMAAAEMSTRLFRYREVTEADFVETGERDFGRAVRKMNEAGLFDGYHGIVTSGMWGGYLSIAQAKHAIRARLRAAAGPNLAARSVNCKVSVGMHVRRGDFGAQPVEQGKFSATVPLDWFVGIAESLQGHFPAVECVVCSDAPDDALEPLLALPSVRRIRGSGPTAAIQELLVLADTDLLACSVSSFSMLGAFLSDKPYLWYAPQLVHEEGYQSLWGDERLQRAPDSPTREGMVPLPAVRPRGIPVPAHGRTSIKCADLSEPAGGWDRRRDLIYYGTVPEVAS